MSQSLVVRVMQAPDGADLFVFFQSLAVMSPFSRLRTAASKKKKTRRLLPSHPAVNHDDLTEKPS